MKRFLKRLYDFSGTWTGAIIVVLFMIFFVAQSFVIPSGSMKRTMLIGDFLFAKKFSYGIPIPELPWIGLKVFPDIHGDGHLIDGPRPKRGDIVIFYVPTDGKTHYVKRCVAVGGDELLYYNKHLLLHPHEGDSYLKSKYPSSQLVTLLDKLWVKDPYRKLFPGIQYKPEYDSNSFQILLQRIGHIDVKPLYISKLKAPTYAINGSRVNVFYKKVTANHYYMMGDNRDNSSDSRFWGSVPYKFIIGKPWFTYFSLEYRSYDRVYKGEGGGRDHEILSKVCGKNADLGSKSCETKWDKYRYSVRWGRIGKNIQTLEKEEPIID